MKTYRVTIQGMTCTGCEEHIARALENIGAVNINASYRHGEATFELPDHADVTKAHEAIREATYQPGEVQEIQPPRNGVAGDEGEYDYLIIGSGGAAFASAIKAVEYGAKVAIIERGTIGGTCVNIGCVPSKTLLRAGEIHHLAKTNPFIGLHTSAGDVDLASLIKYKNELVSQLREQKYVDLIDDYGFELVRGEAKFIDEKTVEAGGRRLTAKRFLIATGASPGIPDIPGLQDVDFVTSTTLLERKRLPKRLVVIGAGYIGLELGTLFNNLGTEVTLLQRGATFLRTYDPEIADVVKQALTEQGINLVTGAVYERMEQHGDVKRVYVTVNGKQKVIEADELLIATGRKPNTEALRLEAAGIQVGSRGEIVVDEYMRTSNPRVYAAGDVTLGPQFVYVAAYEGGIAADNAMGGAARKVNLEAVPGVIFTNPSIATVGLTEQQAKEKGFKVRTSVLPLSAVPRAIVNRETTGIFKLVADAQTSKILGVHVVAENAGDVIYAGTLAVKFGLTIEDLRDSLAPYLTMAEGLKLAAFTFDKDVSKLSCCAG